MQGWVGVTWIISKENRKGEHACSCNACKLVWKTRKVEHMLGVPHLSGEYLLVPVKCLLCRGVYTAVTWVYLLSVFGKCENPDCLLSTPRARYEGFCEVLEKWINVDGWQKSFVVDLKPTVRRMLDAVCEEHRRRMMNALENQA